MPVSTPPAAVPAEPRTTPSALLRALLVFWERLPFYLAFSLFWSLCVSALLAVTRALPVAPRAVIDALGLTILAAAMWAGTCASAAPAGPAALQGAAAFWNGVRGYAVSLTAIFLGDALLAAALATSAWFYGRSGGVVGFALAALSVYGLLALAAAALLQGPLLALQETGALDTPVSKATRGKRAAVRRAFYLVAAAPFTAAGLLFAVAIGSTLMAVTAVPFVLLWPALVPLSAAAVCRAALVRLEIVIPPEPEQPISDEDFTITNSL